MVKPSWSAPPRLPVEKDTVARPEQVLDQRDPPGQTEIASVGVARSVEGPAEMGARRTDDAEEIRPGEQHLEIDVGSRFDVASKNRDIMGEDTEFELVDIWVCAIAMVGPVAARPVAARPAATIAERSISPLSFPPLRARDAQSGGETGSAPSGAPTNDAD